MQLAKLLPLSYPYYIYALYRAGVITWQAAAWAKTRFEKKTLKKLLKNNTRYSSPTLVLHSVTDPLLPLKQSLKPIGPGLSAGLEVIIYPLWADSESPWC